MGSKDPYWLGQKPPHLSYPLRSLPTNSVVSLLDGRNGTLSGGKRSSSGWRSRLARLPRRSKGSPVTHWVASYAAVILPTSTTGRSSPWQFLLLPVSLLFMFPSPPEKTWKPSSPFNHSSPSQPTLFSLIYISSLPSIESIGVSYIFFLILYYLSFFNSQSQCCLRVSPARYVFPPNKQTLA